MLTLADRERDFPSLLERTYLNTAAEGIPPPAVLAALNQYAQDKLLGMDGRPLHEAQWRELRGRTAAMFGLTADEIGLCSCSSEAFNLAMLALRLQAGDEVIINDLDFPAGATPWMLPGSPSLTRLWPARAGALRLEDLKPLLTPRTQLVTVSAVSFYNGYRIPLAPLAEMIRAHSNAMLAVDVTQALGRVPLDLSMADLIVSSTHKWILASHGGGLVGVPQRRSREWTVPAGGWFNLENAFAEDRFQRAVLRPGAGSFMVGMPNYAAIYAVNAGLGYIQSVGVDKIAQQADPLVRQCLTGLRALPVEVITPDDPSTLAGIVAFRHPRAEQLRARLHAQNIHIMATAGRLRVALHGYNTAADVDRFLSVLQESLHHV